MNEAIDKGKFRTGYGFIIISLTIVVILISRYLFQVAFSYKYLQIDRLLAAIIFSLFFLYILFELFEEYKAVTIHQDHIKVKWFFGLISIKIIPEQITQFGFVSNKNIKYIYINTDKANLLLNEYFIENNFLLIDQLRSWRIKRKDNIPFSLLSPAEKRKEGIALMIVGIFLLVIITFNYIISFTPINDDALTAVSGHLSEKPEIQKPRGKSSTKNVIFYLQEYLNISFETGSFGYNLLNHDSLARYHRGEKVTLLIARNDLETKLTHVRKPTFGEKHFDWPTIDVYGVELNKHPIYWLEEYKDQVSKLESSNGIWRLVAVAVAFLLFVFGFKIFSKSRKQRI